MGRRRCPSDLQGAHWAGPFMQPLEERWPLSCVQFCPHRQRSPPPVIKCKRKSRRGRASSACSEPEFNIFGVLLASIYRRFNRFRKVWYVVGTSFIEIKIQFMAIYFHLARIINSDTMLKIASYFLLASHTTSLGVICKV